MWQFAVAKTIEINILEKRASAEGAGAEGSEKNDRDVDEKNKKVIVERDGVFRYVMKSERTANEETWEGLDLDL